MSEHNSKSVTRAEAATAADALYRFWDSGRRVRGSFDRLARTDPATVSYGNREAALAAAAAEHGLNPDLMRKAVNVAGAYTPAEIREICRLVRDRPARFSYSHLTRLMRVPDKPARGALIRDAIRLQWSVGELNTALKASRGRRVGVGKRPKLPRGSRQLLVALEAQCLRFGRWVEAAQSLLPDEIGGPVGRAAGAVAAVQRLVSEQLAVTRRA